MSLKNLLNGVTETKVDDEEGYYEVKILQESGGQTDVHLNKAFSVVGQEDD